VFVDALGSSIQYRGARRAWTSHRSGFAWSIFLREWLGLVEKAQDGKDAYVPLRAKGRFVRGTQ